MIVLGVDPGTAITGYGLVREQEDGGLSIVDYGVILTPPQSPMPERLLLLNRKLREIILLHRPVSGAVEKLFFQRNVRTALAVGQARGVILLSMAETSLNVFEYTPLQVKQAVVGYGGAGKQQVQEMVRAILGLSEIPQPDDAADSLAIAICHIHSNRLLSLINETE